MNSEKYFITPCDFESQLGPSLMEQVSYQQEQLYALQKRLKLAERKDYWIVFARPRLEDLYFLKRWRNDEVTRQFSRRQYEFTDEQIDHWVFNEGRRFQVAWLQHTAVGCLSFENIDNKIWEVSIITAPEYRNKGMGKCMLSLAHHLVNAIELRAQVRNDNVASLHLFQGCGFEVVNKSDEFTNLVKSNPYSI